MRLDDIRNEDIVRTLTSAERSIIFADIVPDHSFDTNLLDLLRRNFQEVDHPDRKSPRSKVFHIPQYDELFEFLDIFQQGLGNDPVSYDKLPYTRKGVRIVWTGHSRFDAEEEESFWGAFSSILPFVDESGSKYDLHIISRGELDYNRVIANIPPLLLDDTLINESEELGNIDLLDGLFAHPTRAYVKLTSRVRANNIYKNLRRNGFRQLKQKKGASRDINFQITSAEQLVAFFRTFSTAAKIDFPLEFFEEAPVYTGLDIQLERNIAKPSKYSVIYRANFSINDSDGNWAYKCSLDMMAEPDPEKAQIYIPRLLNIDPIPDTKYNAGQIPGTQISYEELLDTLSNVYSILCPLRFSDDDNDVANYKKAVDGVRALSNVHKIPLPSERYSSQKTNPEASILPIEQTITQLDNMAEELGRVDVQHRETIEDIKGSILDVCRRYKILTQHLQQGPQGIITTYSIASLSLDGVVQ